MSKENQKIARKPKDHGSNYNTFGYDPDRHIAYFAALFYGPDWVPRITPKQFGSPPAPLHFSPPTPYQEDSLPPGFKPRMHHDYYKLEAAFLSSKKTAPGESDFINPPKEFDPHVFDAFRFGRHFMEGE